MTLSLDQFGFQTFQRGSPEFQIRHRSLATFWKLIVCLSIQHSTRFRFANTAPLLEEKSNSCTAALNANIPDPRSIHGSCSRSAFPTHNHPIDSFQINRAEMLQERLNTSETNLSW